jgi:hypothetical protein
MTAARSSRDASAWYRCRSQMRRTWPACSAMRRHEFIGGRPAPIAGLREYYARPWPAPRTPTRCGSTGSSAAVRTRSRSARSKLPSRQGRPIDRNRGLGHRSGLAEPAVRVRGGSSSDQVVVAARWQRGDRLHPSGSSGIDGKSQREPGSDRPTSNEMATRCGEHPTGVTELRRTAEAGHR